MNLDNYQAKQIAIIVKRIPDSKGNIHECIEFVSDDIEETKNACKAYNTIAEIQKSETDFYVHETIGYFKK